MNLTALAYINISDNVKPSNSLKYKDPEKTWLFYWHNKDCLAIYINIFGKTDDIKYYIKKELQNGKT